MTPFRGLGFCHFDIPRVCRWQATQTSALDEIQESQVIALVSPRFVNMEVHRVLMPRPTERNKAAERCISRSNIFFASKSCTKDRNGRMDISKAGKAETSGRSVEKEERAKRGSLPREGSTCSTMLVPLSYNHVGR